MASSLDNTTGRSGSREAFRKIKPLDWIALASLVLMLGIFIHAGYFTREFVVDVSKVSLEYPHDVYTDLTAEGSIVIGHTVCVSPRVSGHLAEILVHKGDIVKKGRLLAVLETRDDIALRDQADANLKLARANLEQARIGLAEAQASSRNGIDRSGKDSMPASAHRSSKTLLRKAKSAFDIAEATVKSHAASLRVMDMRLGYSRVYAPFDGIVLSRNAYAGDPVRPLASITETQGSILTLADLSSLQAEVEVPEYETDSIKTGQPCSVVIESLKVRLSGAVDSILPPSREDKTTSTVRVSFTGRDPRIMPGMKAGVAFLLHPVSEGDDTPLIVVDRSSLIPAGNGHSAFVVRDEKAAGRHVRIGRQFIDKVEILEGLKPGDLVIANPPDGMENGSRVVVSRD